MFEILAFGGVSPRIDPSVFLELEERNTRDGVIDVSNTVTIYQFNADDKLIKLDVYIGPLGKG